MLFVLAAPNARHAPRRAARTLSVLAILGLAVPGLAVLGGLTTASRAQEPPGEAAPAPAVTAPQAPEATTPVKKRTGPRRASKPPAEVEPVADRPAATAAPTPEPTLAPRRKRRAISPPPAAPAPAAAPLAADPGEHAAEPPTTAASGERRPPDAVMLDRLCAGLLRANEEDRLFGMISLIVRATIRYEGAAFSPEVVSDAAQDALDAMLTGCPRIAATDDPHRLGLVIEMIRDATVKRMAEHRRPMRGAAALRSFAQSTAADLSEELTSHEIDAWLEALAPNQRALALFLYASDVTPQQVADAVGVPPGALNRELAESKARLLSFFREEADIPAGPRGGEPAIQYREAGRSVAGLLKGEPAAATPTNFRISGISTDLFAGWSMLATASGLPRGQVVEINEPIMIEAEPDGGKRMIVTGIVELSHPDADPRRFLLKAYAIDGDSGGVGARETMRLSTAGVDNPRALLTLRNPHLSNIEIARCLWHDYGKTDDPGLCR